MQVGFLVINRSRPEQNRSVSPDPIENTQVSFDKEKHMLNRLARAFFCLTIIISATGYCFAQATGNIKGTVVDPNGGLGAGATVEAVSTQTGEKRTTTTSDSGSYNITNLPVGIYTLTATQTGFGPGTAKD